MEPNRNIHTLEDVHLYDIKDIDGKSYPIVRIDFGDIQPGEDRYHYALRKYNEAVGASAIKRFSDRIPDVPPQPYKRAKRNGNRPLFTIMQIKDRYV